MASDDAGFDETSLDPEILPPGPRRSTYTPPTGSVPASPPPVPEHDDDELANALAADLDRLASGAVPVVGAATVAPPEPTPADIEAPAQAPAGRVWELTPDELLGAEPIAGQPLAAEPLNAEPHNAEPLNAEPFAAETINAEPIIAEPIIATQEPADEPPAWSSLPAPDPSQAVMLPEGPPDIVARDPELASLLEQAGLQPTGGTLSAIEQLEAQLATFGPPPVTPETPPIAFTEPPVEAFAQQPPLQPVWPEPEPLQPPPSQWQAPPPEPVVVDAVPAAPPPLPSWDVPEPSPEWASTLGAEELPDGPVAQMEVPATDGPVTEIPIVADVPWAAEEASRFAPRSDLSDPGQTGLGQTGLGQTEAQETYAPQTFDDEGYAAAPFAPMPPAVDEPPALVEPPPLGGPPILPSQAAGHPPIPVEPIPDYEDVVVAEVVDDTAGAPTPPAPSAFSFDDLVTGQPADYSGAGPDEGRPFGSPGLFEGPPPVTAAEGVPLDTGSIAVVNRVYEGELDDDVDETDRAFAGLIGASAAASPPSGPIATVRIPDDEVVLGEGGVPQPAPPGIEASGPEPTPTDQRIGRAARLFWLWFAANSSILGVGLGAVVFAVGMSLRQSVVAIIAGIAVSVIPLALSTLAGKRSGQPTMIVSRSTFGVVGNVIPALLAVVTRVFWGAVLLWLLASAVAVVLVGAELDGGLGDRLLVLIALGGAAAIALLIAIGGYRMIARLQLVLTIASAILVVGFIVMTFSYVDLSAALTTPDGSWLLTVTGAVLVFSFVGLVWAMSGADVARYQRPDSSGGASAVWASVGALVPSFVLIGYGALLAASDKGIASGFVQSPLDTLALMLPNWYPVPLIAAAVLSLLSGVVITIYSGGFALQAVGIRLPRVGSVVIVGLLIAGAAVGVTLTLTGITELFRDLATTLAVPTAAWVGIFGAEVLLRKAPISGEGLLSRQGIYGAVRWGNLIGLLIITAIGFGLTTASVSWLSWQGYLFGLLGLPADDPLAGSDLGVLVALGLGLLLPIVIGIGAIRRQEQPTERTEA